ncbi:hypothetical protein BSG1_14108 [Bacillus sp. SG-1]|nr:hypothetical protein BSG1_14108 [Bacillus sp. SG-1]
MYMNEKGSFMMGKMDGTKNDKSLLNIKLVSYNYKYTQFFYRTLVYLPAGGNNR